MTSQEMAKIAGVTDKAISTWESGTRIPRMGAIQKMADYFGLQKSDIIEDNSRI
ncbi:MAG: helix-turn-helix transcriptional regulator, partial [Lachnospiraceae bacterium]|nr:helix-turn-helix transcriptional regulator [Lachnospiraceae bacterium]